MAMRRSGIAGLAIVLLTLFPAGSARAVQFISIGADPSISSPNLNIYFKEAGLGSAQLIIYQATSDATAEYECVEGSGNTPDTDVTASATNLPATYSVIKAGSVIVPPGSEVLTISPPSALPCPGEQTPSLERVRYTHVVLTDTTHHLSDYSLYNATFTYP